MKKILPIITFLFLLASCSTSTPSTIVDVNAEEAKQLIDEGVTVLDVRTASEYEDGHITNATLIPLNELENRLNELDKETQYVVVCRSGNRSAQASKILAENDFKHIYNMQGGMNNWMYEIEK
jgi:rhodanese-related sulfurtransferase